MKQYSNGHIAPCCHALPYPHKLRRFEQVLGEGQQFLFLHRNVREIAGHKRFHLFSRKFGICAISKLLQQWLQCLPLCFQGRSSPNNLPSNPVMCGSSGGTAARSAGNRSSSSS